MRLRWKVSTYKYTTWNSREDCYDNHTQYNDPVLQFLDTDGKWKNVPIEEVEIK